MRLARALLDRCRALTKQINERTAEITTLVADMVPSLIAISGCGAITAAQILGETVGFDRFRQDRSGRFRELRARRSSPAERRRSRVRHLHLRLDRRTQGRGRRTPSGTNHTRRLDGPLPAHRGRSGARSLRLQFRSVGVRHLLGARGRWGVGTARECTPARPRTLDGRDVTSPHHTVDHGSRAARNARRVRRNRTGAGTTCLCLAQTRLPFRQLHSDHAPGPPAFSRARGHGREPRGCDGGLDLVHIPPHRTRRSAMDDHPVRAGARRTELPCPRRRCVVRGRTHR